MAGNPQPLDPASAGEYLAGREVMAAAGLPADPVMAVAGLPADPVMAVTRTGFTLEPTGFFDRNPMLDVPAPSGHCHPE